MNSLSFSEVTQPKSKSNLNRVSTILGKSGFLFVFIILNLTLAACNLSNLTSRTVRVRNLCTTSMNIYLDSSFLGLVVKGDTNDFNGISAQTHTLSARFLDGTLFTSNSVDFSSSDKEWILCP